jgi:hypothetical protein
VGKKLEIDIILALKKLGFHSINQGKEDLLFLECDGMSVGK